MANIGINITENGTTTLATAGKYCDRNIDVVVEVAGSGGGGSFHDIIPEESCVLTGDCTNACTNDNYFKGWLLTNYPKELSSNGITGAVNLFNSRKDITEIPFTLDFGYDYNVQFNLNFLFGECQNLKHLPPVTFSNTITNVYAARALFNNCYVLREIPDDWTTFLVWIAKHPTSAYSYVGGSLFAGCRALRKIPSEVLLAFGEMRAQGTYTIYNQGFNNCSGLDEIVGLGCNTQILSGNGFSNTFVKCGRVKNITFAIQEDGTPYVRDWKSQTIDLSQNVGYVASNGDILSYDTGLTEATWIKDGTTYQALKDNPDSWTQDANYSRYNHDSAVATINSLPDTSAYLATAGGTNTIKFKGAAGASTDGGAINTLTDAEIAVAAAKGWTVTLV